MYKPSMTSKLFQYSSLCMGIAFSGLSNAQEYTLAITTDAYAPYNFTEEGTVKGLLVEYLSSIENSEFDFVYTEMPRKRIGRTAEENKWVFRAASEKWIKKDTFLVTSPLFHFEDYLFTKNPDLKSVSKLEDVIGYSICTNSHFIYSPKLTELFKQNKIERIDASREFLKFKMLDKGRCDFLISEYRVAQNVIRQNPPFNNIEVTQIKDASWPISFIVHKEQTALFEFLENHINQASTSAFIEALAQKYLPN